MGLNEDLGDRENIGSASLAMARFKDRIIQLQARAEAAEKRDAELRNMLRRLEWCKEGACSWVHCPNCGSVKYGKSDSHADGCELDALLKEDK